MPRFLVSSRRKDGNGAKVTVVEADTPKEAYMNFEAEKSEYKFNYLRTMDSENEFKFTADMLNKGQYRKRSIFHIARVKRV